MMHLLRPDIRATDRTRRRAGFTLIELLVVVAIIVLLMSLVGLAVFASLGTAKITKTRSTITKVQSLLQQRLDAVTKKGPDKTLTDSLVNRFQNRKQAEAMAIKFTFRQAFPQTWAEIALYYPNLLPQSGQTAPMTTKPTTESAEVLYFLLTQANVLGYPPEGVDVFDSTEARDTDGNGKLELIDAWGMPLRFYRWPTRLVRGGAWTTPGGSFTPPNMARGMMPSLPTVAADLTHDADDKYGFLRVTNSVTTGLLTAEVPYYEQGTAPMGNRFFGMGPFETPETYSFPLIVSAGPDLSTGLFEPGDMANFGYLAAADSSQPSAAFDNISNLSTRSGGK